MNKKEIRKLVREKRESLLEHEVKERSEKIITKFLETDYYKKAKVIMSYMPIKNEVDVVGLNKKILRDKKKLILPVINKYDEITPGEVKNLNMLRKENKYSIMEPDLSTAYESVIDLIIVPGVAFDRVGNRIGFGKGYYDKFLLDKSSITIALIYEFQISKKIPIEQHDEGINIIITEGDIIYAG